LYRLKKRATASAALKGRVPQERSLERSLEKAANVVVLCRLSLERYLACAWFVARRGTLG